ncbi:MAG: hypothetical protein ACK5OA_16140 [Acidovorax sp.]
MFVNLIPGGPPTPIGGSASAKKVAQGGKLGVVQDPFGKLGAPKYLGATLPLDGYGIINLSLSEDGKVLIGQLSGGFSVNWADSLQKPHQNHVWRVKELIDKALANDQPMSKHIKLAKEAEQLIPINVGKPDYTAPPAGTAFDPDVVPVAYNGRMGDVIELDLMELSIDAMARQVNGLPDREALPIKQMTAAQLAEYNAARAEIEKSNGLTDFTLDPFQAFLLTTKDALQFKMVSKTGSTNDREPYSRDNPIGNTPALTPAKFTDTGRLYLIPDITDKEVNTLRAGGRLEEKVMTLDYKFKMFDDHLQADRWRAGRITIKAKDIDQVNTFFGDRPLDNPGYSEFSLKGAVGVNQANDRLDVARVEQRLKYLGFPAMGANDPVHGQPSQSNNAIQNFEVDGNWTQREGLAALLFKTVVNYNADIAGRSQIFPHATRNSFNAQKYYQGIGNSANNLTFSQATAPQDSVITYLNSYNAPHWMNIGSNMQQQSGAMQTNFRLANWNNRQTANTGGAVEKYGTSWMYDLMQASNLGPAALSSGRIKWFNGAVDANHGYTPYGHGSHDVGMALDLGVSNYISKTRPGATADSETGNQFNNQEPVGIALLPNAQRTWSIQNAIAQATATGLPENAAYLSSGVNLGSNLQQSALKDFLSMYTVVRNDAAQGVAVAGSRGSLAITNSTVMRNGQVVDVSESIRTALFGGGTSANSLINRVLIGGTGTQNSLENIRNALSNLGINNAASRDHQNHFHIYLRPPSALEIEPNATNLEASITAPNNSIGEKEASLILARTNQPENLEIIMMDAFINNALTDFDKPAIHVAVKNTAQSAKEITDCRDIMLSVPEGRNNIALFNHPAFKSIPKSQKTSVVKLIQAPKLGSLHMNPDFLKQDGAFYAVTSESREVLIDRSSWYYDAYPTNQAEGKDRAVFEIEVGARKYLLTVNFFVAGIPEESIDAHTECRKLKMHLPDKKLSGTLEDWFSSADRSAYLSAASQVTYSFANLPGSAVCSSGRGRYRPRTAGVRPSVASRGPHAQRQENQR